MKKIITCLFAAFICFGLVTQQADTKSWKKILKPDKKESKEDKPAENKDSKQDKPADNKDSKKGKYNIGDKGPGGGIVFHVEGNTYFEVSPILGAYKWEEAVKVAKNYKGGGFTNWQLSTKIQLENIYMKLKKKGIVNLDDTVYWSSSESAECACAWYQNFGNNGYQEIGNKASICSVLAVRSFTP